MMMTPSSRLSMPSKSTERSTQKCKNFRVLGVRKSRISGGSKGCLNSNDFYYFRFKHSLMTFGDKFTSSEVDNAFSEFVIEDGMIDAVQLKGLMVSKKEEGEE